MSTRTRKDVILWGALGCALVSTAHAEYTLATAAHFNEWVALAVPGALDLYVVRALQQRRDVFVAVLAMVAANVASHLIAGGVLEVRWPVIAAVGAVAPLIVWRVYSLKYTRTRQELLWGTGVLEEAGAVSAPGPKDEYAHSVAAYLAGVRAGDTSTPALAPVLEPSTAWEPCTRPMPYGARFTDRCEDCGYAYGVHRMHDAPVPYSVEEQPEYAVPDHVPGDWDEASTRTPLHSVPDLPDEYATSAVHSVELENTDWEFLPGAQRYVDDIANPSVRGLMKALSIGQKRAQRLLAHLEVQP